MRNCVVVLTLGALIACDAMKTEEVVERPDPSAWDFTVVFEITTPFDRPDHRPPETAVLYRNGARLGGPGEVYELSKDEFLADAELTLHYDTTCGEEVLPAKVHKTLDAEKAYRAMRIQEWLDMKNGKYGETHPDWGDKPTQGLTISTQDPLPKRTRKLAVDNRRGKEATTVTLGTVDRRVPAGEFVIFDLPVGSCDEALAVSLDGDAQGVLDWSKKKYRTAIKPTATIEAADPLGAHQSWLLDTTGDGCYVIDAKRYVSASDNYAYGAIPTETLKSKPKRRLHETGPIFLYFEPFPASLEGDGGATLARLGDCAR